ncbi:hypothetical protein [Sphingomonas sp.]|jgi:hypothetical protein|uniref:hypothetical protein n=1 Tax=Sphingomonas sp. TaxID=28214 RepID=UPI002D7E4D8A|nr:hypothetical protein [Sphingomonas sp.]HEU0045085.1 hypothetical protein [Sphingomonas sp.]
MSAKKSYTVHRAMHGDGRDWARGDTREMAEADAAPLVATGAVALKGEVPVKHGPAVRHTFGTDVGASTYVSAATGKDVVVSKAETHNQPTSLIAETDVSDSRVEGRRSPARKG